MLQWAERQRREMLGSQLKGCSNEEGGYHRRMHGSPENANASAADRSGPAAFRDSGTSAESEGAAFERAMVTTASGSVPTNGSPPSLSAPSSSASSSTSLAAALSPALLTTELLAALDRHAKLKARLEAVEQQAEEVMAAAAAGSSMQ